MVRCGVPSRDRQRRFQLRCFALYVRAAGHLEDEALIAQLGPGVAEAMRADGLALRLATFGEWMMVSDAHQGFDLERCLRAPGVCIPARGDVEAGAPVYDLGGLVRFDVFAHSFDDAGQNYLYELHREGALVRRFRVDEVEPWSTAVRVVEDFGPRLPGEPTPSRTPRIDTDAVPTVVAVLRALGALPSVLDAPVDYRIHHS